MRKFLSRKLYEWFGIETRFSMRVDQGYQEWISNGQRHREDGPAIECDNGDKVWFCRGQRHREDGPAVESFFQKDWYRHGELHREDGPAIEGDNGDKYWYHHGKLHREDGPAIEWANGDKVWYRHGELHREDGPVYEFQPQSGPIYIGRLVPQGSLYWLDGVEYPDEVSHMMAVFRQNEKGEV